MAGKTRPSLRRKVLYNVEHSNLNATDKECIKAVFEKFDDAKCRAWLKINADSVMNTCDTCKCNKVCDHDKFGFENCGNYISEDAVEVVRCKDCKYAVLTTGEDFVVGCENCGYDILERDKNDFCSQGKRRDDN